MLPARDVDGRELVAKFIAGVRSPSGPPTPYTLSNHWRHAVKSRKLPKVTFHALRHSHASALIAAGLDVVSVSRRLGHANPTITLSVYAHLFKNKDADAAAAMDAALESGG